MRFNRKAVHRHGTPHFSPINNLTSSSPMISAKGSEAIVFAEPFLYGKPLHDGRDVVEAQPKWAKKSKRLVIESQQLQLHCNENTIIN